MTPIDIRADHLRIVHDVLARHLPDGVRVWVFGSRATWATKDSSDLDLALEGDGEIAARSLAALESAFEDSELPYAVDVVDVKRIGEPFREIVVQQRVALPLQTRVDSVDWARRSEGLPRVIEQEHAVLANEGGARHWAARPARSIEDVCSRVTSGGTPSRRDPSFYENGCWPWLKTQELRDGWLDDSEEHITDDAVASSSAKVLPQNTILMAMYGATVGQLGILRRPMTCNQACCAMLVDPGQADYRYLFYLLLHARPRIRNLSTGAAQQNLSGQVIKSLTFPFPTLPEQRAIAHVLGTLDDKIELNRRMNATLEALARALFRSWFVDFDPVRAKVEGRDTGLPKEIADLFPDRLVDSKLGKIPRGWNIGCLAEHFEAVKGVSYKGSGLRRDGMPLHNLNSVDKRGGYRCDGIKYYSGDYADRHVVCPGDVIVANTDLGRENLLIGYSAIVPRLFGDSGIVSHHLYRVRARPSGRLSTVFLYCLLNSPQMHDVVAGYANGTTVTMLPIDALQMPAVVEPPSALLEVFDELALGLEHRREQAVGESRTLGALRDALVPRMVSGELRVRDAERLVGAIA